VDQIELSLFHDGYVYLLAVLPCPISPLCHGALIQIKCLHNGLYRTTIGEQRYHDDNQLGWLA
jgi:hypothetical protein